MARDLRVVKGNDVNSQIRSIDSFLAGIDKQSTRKTICVAPAEIPLSCVVREMTEGQVILEYFFPTAGSITKVSSRLSGFKSVGINITMESADAYISKDIMLYEGSREAVAGIKVTAGDLMTVTINSCEREVLNANPFLALGIVFIGDISTGNAVKLAQRQLSEE